MEIQSPRIDIHFGDNLPILRDMETESVDFIYIDPPFNSGKRQSLTQVQSIRDDEKGGHTGFGGRNYRNIPLGSRSFEDQFDDFLLFLEPRLVEAWRLLAPRGSLFLHLDYREIHYAKVLLDSIAGRRSFMNEIIWAYDYGGRSKKRWPTKHDTLLFYAKDPKNYTFNFEEMDRIPYMAPGLVGKEKAARGKTPTDVWWHTIVPTNSSERTGYPTQKPLGILDRLVKVHTRPGNLLLDFFAGSGTLGESAWQHKRSAILIDSNPEAIEIMVKRLAQANPTVHSFSPESESV